MSKCKAHMEDGPDAAGNIGGMGRGAAGARLSGEAQLVVHHQMQRAPGVVS